MTLAIDQQEIKMSAHFTNLTNPNSTYFDRDRIEITINGQVFARTFTTDHRSETRWQKFADAMRCLGESIARYAENDAIGKCQHCGRVLE